MFYVCEVHFVNGLCEQVKYSFKFEPYYIAQSGAPLFSEFFDGRGANFAQQVYELYASGYSFHVLPKVRSCLRDFHLVKTNGQ